MNKTRMKMTCQEYNFESFEITEENQAAANYLLSNSSNLSDSEILYIKADDFINELILSIGDNKSIQLKEKYNNLKFLFLDDVQDFYEKSVSQNVLENIFDHIEINGGSIVFSATRCIT